MYIIFLLGQNLLLHNSGLIRLTVRSTQYLSLHFEEVYTTGSKDISTGTTDSFSVKNLDWTRQRGKGVTRLRIVLQ